MAFPEQVTGQPPGAAVLSRAVGSAFHRNNAERLRRLLRHKSDTMELTSNVH